MNKHGNCQSCDSTAEILGNPANPDWAGYECCPECIEWLDSQPVESSRVAAWDGSEISYVDAQKIWEAGEFSDWAELHGNPDDIWPITVAGDDYWDWESLEGALSYYPASQPDEGEG